MGRRCCTCTAFAERPALSSFWLVTLRLLGRSLCMVRSWIGLGCLGIALGLSACGQQSSPGTTGSTLSTARSQAVSVGSAASNGDVQPSYPGGVVSVAGRSLAWATHPEVRPGEGGPRTTFVVRLTSRALLGVHGVFEAAYRVGAAGPSAPACDAAAESTITRGAVGQRLRVAFSPGRIGWCVGQYRGVVYLQRGPHCTQGPVGTQSRTCPEFASQLLEVGRFSWQVR